LYLYANSCILDSLPPDIPQVLINRESLQNMTFDVELLGNGDNIVAELCKRLKWEGLEDLTLPHMEEVTRDQLKTPPPVLPSSSNRFDLDRVSSTTDNDKLTGLNDNIKRSDGTHTQNNDTEFKGEAVIKERNNWITNEADIVVDVPPSATDSGISNFTSAEERDTTVDSTETSHKDLEKNNDKTENKDSEKQLCSLNKQGETNTSQDAKGVANIESKETDQADGAEGEGENIMMDEASFDKEDDIIWEESDLELMRSMWQPKRRESLSQRLEG